MSEIYGYGKSTPETPVSVAVGRSCSRSPPGAGHKRRAAKAGQRRDYGLSQLLTLVPEGFRVKCPYCRCELNARNFSVDHAVRTCRGGYHDWQNLKICFRGCNEIKGVLTVDEFES